VSETTASGTGGTAAPGWYADPHDPQQLRWWSGEAWTEHVSPKSVPASRAAQAATGEQTAQPTDEPTVEPAVEPAQASVPVVTSAPVTETSATGALPSRRALRESSADSGANAAAGQTAQPSLYEQRAAADLAAQQAVQAASQDQAASQGRAASQEAAPEANPVRDDAVQPALIEPSIDQNAWNQPAQTPQLVQPDLPIQSDLPVQSVESAQSVDSAQPSTPAVPKSAWDLPVQDAEPESGLDALFGAQAMGIDDADTDNSADTADGGTAETDNSDTDTAGTNIADTFAAGAFAPATPVATDSAPLSDTAGAASAGQWGLTPSGRRAGDGRRLDAPAPVENSSTPWLWLVAVSPLIAAVAIVLASATSGGKPAAWMLVVAVVVPYLLVLLFAVADRSRLVILGFEAPVTWAWAALTAPVYLIMRAGVVRRESSSGGPGLVVWFVCFLLAIVVVLVYGLLSHQPLIVGLPG
jgi:hypothetical protein